METLQVILLVISLVALGKALLLLLAPTTSKRIVEWWVGMPDMVLRTLGLLAILAGCVFIGCAIAEMRDPVIGAVTILGTLFVVGGMLYQWPTVIRALSKPFGINGRTWAVRAVALLAFTVAIVLFVVLFLSLRTP